jgi:hypothetical protein
MMGATTEGELFEAGTGGSNAIAFVQVRLRGGWRNLASTGALYGLAIGAAAVAAVRVVDVPPAQVYAGLLRFLLGIQVVLLLLVGGSRVSAAIRYDVTSRMIESHRLMPVGAGRAVAGYLLGATSQATVLAGVTLVAGVLVAAGAGVSPADWLWANAVVALFAGLVWAVLAHLAFATRSAVGWTVVPGLALWATQGYLLTAVPAAGLLAGPLVGPTAFALRGPSAAMAPAYVASALAQAAVAGVCLAAARRRYARDDAVGLSPALGLALLAALAAATWAGMELEPLVRPAFLRPPRSSGPLVQLVCSLLLLMLMALLPVAAAARLEDEWRRRRTRDPAGTTGRRPLPVLAVALAAAAVVAAVPALILSAAGEGVTAATDLFRPCVSTAAVVAVALVACGYAGRLAHRLGRAGRPVVVVWLLVAWAGPVVADVMRLAQSSSGGGHGTSLGFLSACSPAGAAIVIWQDALDSDGGNGLPIGGFVVQVAAAALVAALSRSAAGRRSGDPAAAARCPDQRGAVQRRRDATGHGRRRRPDGPRVGREDRAAHGGPVPPPDAGDGGMVGRDRRAGGHEGRQ